MLSIIGAGTVLLLAGLVGLIVRGVRRAPTTPQQTERTVTTRRRHRVGARGVAGAGGGKPAYVPVPLAWRATAVQVCGLFPWRTPGPPPRIGTPIGRHVESRATVCFDHISWFLAKLIGNPSMLVIGKPGTGKSTLISRILLGVAAAGYQILIPGDTKPDYTSLTDRLGGHIRVIERVGGPAALNPCDPGGMAATAARIGGEEGAALMADAIGRATVCVATLVEIGRGDRLADYEESTLTTALRLLYEQMATGNPEPTISDVEQLIGLRPVELQDVLLTTTDEEFDRLTKPLRRSLRALLNGQYGDVFTRRVDRSEARPPAVNIDTSRIKAGDERFLAAVMVTAWSEAYGIVEADQALAAAGLAKQPLYCLVLDELWRVLQLGPTMARRVDELTRLNRTRGIGQIMATHSSMDGTDGQVHGLEERAGVIVVGAVPITELDRLERVLTFTDRERSMIRSWWSSRSAGSDAVEGERDAAGNRVIPPGAGKFLIKPSADDPGIPVQVVLSSVEDEWGGQDTNSAWRERIDELVSV
jgi:hypothetical protein